MSKYIKLEDAIHNINLEVTGRKEYTGDMKANLFFALDDLPTIEVSEDCISRKGLIDSFLADNECKREEAKACLCKLDFMLELIEDAPSVVPSRAEGEWQTHGSHCKCSLCGYVRFGSSAEYCNKYVGYCEKCGAKMKGAE